MHTIRVEPAGGESPRGAALLREIKALGITSIKRVDVIKVYRLEGLSDTQAAVYAAHVLTDLDERVTINETVWHGPNYVAEVAYKPGVMNPEVGSLLKAARDLGINLAAADSSHEYHFFANNGAEDREILRDVGTVLDRLLVNKTVAHVVTEEPATLVIAGSRGPIELVTIRDLSAEQLVELSQSRKLYLGSPDMRALQWYFRQRQREPTDAELDLFGPAWSEHCDHGTFKANLIVDGVPKQPLMTRIREVSQRFFEKVGVLSAFVDNSGVVLFYDGWAICGKVETHNSPSAIEPYGGAATGSGGVFRDIMGTGKGGKVILSTDIFCVAPWNLADCDLPAGCLHPDYLLRNVVAGVRDYGNRMGIPTANGSVHFHRDFRAKPTIIVGAYGLIPAKDAPKGEPQPGDAIIVVGGRTGRDGILGANFSSVSMSADTGSVHARAVQVGHAIEEKRTADGLLVCRDRGLVRAIGDCGAGGLLVIFEMAGRLGVRWFLERAPVKYPGLSPRELMISESQERMVLAAAPENAAEVLQVMREHNVEATVLGEFTDDGVFRVTYDGELVCELESEFVHNGRPQRTLNAAHVEPALVEPIFASPQTPEEWKETLLAVVSHPNVCSKEPIVRQYDHGVQGTNALPPFTGVMHDGPNDAVVLTPLLGKPYGLAVGHGLNPVLNTIDPYRGTIAAIVEAVSNVVAVGADPDTVALIDNFIWPTPDAETLGALDRSVDACVDAATALQMPFVSGKDSLSSTYRGKDGTVIKIPPVLCCSAFGKLPDVSKTVDSSLKGKLDSRLMLWGPLLPEALGGSVYYDTHGCLGARVPQIDLTYLRDRLQRLYGMIQDGVVISCHDISEGGLLVTLAEMCFGSERGVAIDLDYLVEGYTGSSDRLLFCETVGSFVLEVDAVWSNAIYQDLPGRTIGRITSTPTISASRDGRQLFEVEVAELKAAWKAPMQEVFR